MPVGATNGRVVNYEHTRFSTEDVLDLRDNSLRVLKLRRAIAGLEARPGIRFLELGCGEGAIPRTLKRLFPDTDVHGCDISKAQLERAQRQGGGVDYRLSGATLPYDDGFFDAVLVMDVLEHLDEPDATVAEIARVLRRGGRLLLHCPCEGQPGTLHWLCWHVGMGADLKKNVAGHVQRYTHRSLFQLIGRHGLVCKRHRYAYHLFGQAFDLLSFCRQFCQMEIDQGRSTLAKRWMTWLPWYRVFPFMERVAGVESRFLGRLPLAMGLDASFEKA